MVVVFSVVNSDILSCSLLVIPFERGSVMSKIKGKAYNEEWFRNDGERVKFIEDTIRKALKERANIWPTYIESATSILENDGNCDGVRDCGSCPFQYLAIGELAGTCNSVEGCEEKLKEEAGKFLGL